MSCRPVVIAWWVLLCFVLGGCAAGIAPPTVPDRRSAWGSDLPLPDSLRRALAQGRLEWLDGPDRYDIPVRVYGPRGPKTPLILVHGLQSHSGWFAQSAAFIAGLGHPVYAMDRRGSGLSQAPRGDVGKDRAWTRELLAVAEQVRHRHRHDRVYVMGHCFGAIPAAAFADRYPDLVKGLLLATPAIYARTGLTLDTTVRSFLSSRGYNDDYLPVPWYSEWFSEFDDFEAFLLLDPLALHAVTGNFYWQAHQTRQHLQKSPSRLTMPVMMAVAGEDPVADNEENLAWLTRTASPRIVLLRYQNARHVLEFSSERERFFADLAAWLNYVESF